MTEIKKLVKSLHPLERKILPFLAEGKTARELEKDSKLKDIEVMRSLQWLQNKEIVILDEELKEVIELDENGIKYAKNGLPEKKFLQELAKKNTLKVSEIKKVLGLSDEEVNICIGSLRKKVAIELKKEAELTATITEQGKKLLAKETFEEKFLQNKFPIELGHLKDESLFAFEELKKRKNIIKKILVKTIRVRLTETGKKLIKEKVDIDVTDALTSDILKNGSWRGKEFRSYDVKINVPKIHCGRKQHYRRFLEDVRRKFLALGFKEGAGPAVETEFWDMDALYMPQFHSARDIHAGYRIKEPKYGGKDIPPEVLKKVKDAHQTGHGTGSKGWGYEFDEQKTKTHVLRTHDTAISSRMLSSSKLEIPGKYFQIARCFRPDVIDAKHSVDFNQCGGFVIDEGLNFAHLKGLLKLFAEEFAETDQIKIRPDYFPFTEPSAALFAKHPELGWIELGGSGIFRPELVKPLVGKDIPVIAWGIGIDRMAMFKLGLNDIRNLYGHDFELLRNIKME
ncbi:MAG: phenylalanine--tRNA ligase subunit alpha [Nanoarchaeota archaeon]|nr:phenylalanine--tRNA ligase subunit alpha [Nanoarchaeota archaeon]